MSRRSASEAQKWIACTSSKRERRFRGRSWAILGRLGAILGLLGAVLGPSWGHLGAILAPSCETLGPRNLDFTMVFAAFALYRRSCSDLLLSFGDLDLSFAILGHLGAVLGHLGPVFGHLGPSWCPSLGHLGPSWGHLGPSWGRLGAFLGPSWPPTSTYVICCGNWTALFQKRTSLQRFIFSALQTFVHMVLHPAEHKLYILCISLHELLCIAR